ncbi:hypothetical protein IFM89_011406 [Coptis chinensis]|uniref:Uncharacterized protein n=1 Tax=Coptis chinensis TaxID=261450 RepID=A0A835HJP8_9MAGN|nr:hypothetical protein IFM89_011406 [Coptis chinensis]
MLVEVLLHVVVSTPALIRTTQGDSWSCVGFLLTNQNLKDPMYIDWGRTIGHSLSRQPMVSCSGQICELQNMGGRVIAIGRIFGDQDEVPENTYRILVGEILEFHAELFGARGKAFGDIDVGSTVTWPQAFTNVI